MKKLLATLGAAVIGLAIAAPASARFIAIKITSKNNDYIQVSEVQAFSGTTNIALASNGAHATAFSSQFGFTGPDKAIDGFNDGQPYGHGIYISNGTGPSEYLLITFASPQDLTSLSIFGREDANQDRDIFNYQLFSDSDPTGRTGSVTGVLDARGQGANNFGLVTFGAVPEPALWVMMIAGFGLVGATMRYRRRNAATVAYA